MFMLLLSLACTPFDTDKGRDSGSSGAGDDTGAAQDTATDDLSAALVVTSAFDPLRGGRVTVAVDFPDGATARVAVLDGDGQEVALLVEALPDSDTFSWDGHLDSGAPAPVGAYQIVATVSRGAGDVEAAQEVHAVRLGALDGALGGERLPLVWHRAAGPGAPWAAPTDAQTFSIAALDDGEHAVDLPEPITDLEVPPAEDAVGVNWPAGYRYDAVPTLSVTLGGDLGGYAGDLAATLEGWTLTSGAVAPGEALAFTYDGTLSDGPGVVERSSPLQIWAGDDLVAEQPLPLRMYALLGAPTFDEGGDRYGAWLAAVDPALRAIAGVAPTDEAVLGGLVAYIFEDLGLVYDTTYGASAYVSYRQGSWSRAHFNFTSFLARTNGAVINCTDAAAILGGHANMIGAELSYLILDPRFDLNYILAIGGSQFTSCPFGPNSCGFSYHAVTSPDGGATIYDATLSIDGDGDPGALPATAQLVQGLSGDGYIDAIVRQGSPSYHSESKGTIQ